MPELPEVQTVVNSLAPRIVGAVIRGASLIRSDILTPIDCDFCKKIAGKQIVAISRRAKRIVFQLEDGNRFFVHLGMTGRLLLEDSSAALRKHTHLIVDFLPAKGETVQLRFVDPRRFGGIWWMGDSADDHGLGPEPLEMSAAQLGGALKRTRRFIKTALLDQRLIAGLGNIYVDEALHNAGIHPLVRANHLKRDQVSRLMSCIKKVLARAIRHKGSTLRDYVDAEGNQGDFQKVHRVYARDGLPCLTCRTAIRKITVGGRSTHFCPDCQSRRR